jgi:predicted permease
MTRKARTGTSPRQLLPLQAHVLQILVALAERDRHGYALLAAIEQRSPGEARLGTSTLYASLVRLLKLGAIADVAPPDDADSEDQRRSQARGSSNRRRHSRTEGGRTMTAASRTSRIYARLIRIVHRDIDQESAAEAATVFAERRRAALNVSLRAWLAVWWLEARALLEDAVSTRRRPQLPSEPARRVTPGLLAELEHVLRDVNYAARQLARTPVFTIVAVASVGLGIVGVLAVFTAANATLWRPMPGVPDADRVVGLFYGGESSSVWSYPDFEDVARDIPALASVAALSTDTVVITPPESGPREVLGQQVSADYFAVLQVPLVLGRSFGENDPAEVVVIGHRLWKRDFDGDPNVLGRRLDIRGRQHTVIGVAPPGLLAVSAPAEPQVYHPISEDQLHHRGWLSLDVFGRMRDDASIDQVQAQASVAAARLFEDYPDLHRTPTGQPWTIQAVAGPRGRVSPTDRPAILGGVGGALAIMVLILLVAATNLANMALTRGLRRRAELGVRLALGAARRRLVSQLLTESLLVSLLAGLLAVITLHWATAWLASGPVFAAVPAGIDLRVDGRVLLFALGVATVAGMAIGLLPAVHATGTNLASAVRSSSTAARARSMLRSGLVTMQLAASLVLIVAAMLFTRSLGEAHRMDLGFEPEGVSVMEIDLGDRQYSDEVAERFFERAEEELASVPGVEALAFARLVPLSGTRVRDVGFEVEGYEAPPDRPTSAGTNVVSPGYFRMMGMHLAAGREFTEDDRRGAPEVVVVDQTFADTYWPGLNPIGRRIDGRTVVGVAASSRFSSLSEPPSPFIWSPVAQAGGTRLVAHVRTIGDPQPIRRQMEQVVLERDSALLVQATAMTDATRGALLMPRVLSVTFAAAGALALGLATLGVYGVMSYVVGMRSREMGIRLALGATRRQLVALIMREGASLSAVGFTVGLALAVAAALVTKSLLVGITPLDPVSIGAGVLLLVAAAAAACYLPARRASRVDPVASLRAD